MEKLTEKEEKEILESSPRGTWAIMLIYAMLFVLGYLYFWFGLFLPRGAVS